MPAFVHLTNLLHPDPEKIFVSASCPSKGYKLAPARQTLRIGQLNRVLILPPSTPLKIQGRAVFHFFHHEEGPRLTNFGKGDEHLAVQTVEIGHISHPDF